MSGLDRRIVAAVVAFGGLCAGAQAGVWMDNNTDAAHRAIGNEGRYDATGYVLWDVPPVGDGGFFLGSTTLIHPEWILSAAHVLTDGTTFATPSQVSYGFGPNINSNQESNVSQVIHHPSYVTNNFPRFDLVLMRVSDPILDHVAAPVIPASGVSDIGVQTALVGYGRGGVGSTGASTDAGIKRGGYNTVDRTSNFGAGGLFLEFDLDAPPGQPVSTTMGLSTPVANEYLIAPGDSGGSAYVFRPGDSRPVLAGVHSYGTSVDGNTNFGYSDIGGSLSLRSFRTWLSQYVPINNTNYFNPITSSTEWSVANNWGLLRTPNAADEAYLVDGRNMTVSTGTNAADLLTVAGAGVTQTGGTLSLNELRLRTSADGNGRFDLDGGTLNLNGGTLSRTGSAVFDMTGGRLESVGVADGNLRIIGGRVAPGISAGLMQINGRFDLDVGGTLEIELGGTAASQYDRLNVTGTADLDGNIAVRLLGGYLPEPGTSYDIVTAGGYETISGNILNETGLAGLLLSTSQSGGVLSLLAEAAIAGDANLDGTVDFTDFNIILGSFGGTGDWFAGDFDGNGVIDFADFNIVLGNFGSSVTGMTLSAAEYAAFDLAVAAFIPEPTLGTLTALPLLALRRRRRA
ncbi:MAG: trypsin-like serine protease [Phycisphaerae bacterium]